MRAPLRSFISALAAVVLLLAVATSECVFCQASVFASSHQGACCSPDGRCKTSNHKSPSDRCLKAHNSEVASIKQSVHLQTVVTASTLEVTGTDPVLRPIETPAPLTSKHSPPEPYLLNSVFLI